MKTPPPEKPFDPDDPNVDPWADDPNAPKEPGYYDSPDDDIPWSEGDFDGDDDDDDSDDYEFPPDGEDEEEATPTPVPAAAPPGALGPAALFDSQLRGEIEFEILFQQTKTAFRAARPETTDAIPTRFVQWPVVIALAGWGAIAHGAAGFAAVLAAKLLHELGHLLGQRLFGYREPDLPNVAFPARWLPANADAPLAHRAITFLLGPLPGLALAFVLQWALAPAIDGALQFFVLMLLAFNLAELWVTNAGDGGRFFERVPFLRGPWPNVAARALGVGLLAAAAAAVPGIALRVLLGAMAGLLALGTLRAWRVAKSRQALGNIFENLPERAADISDAQLRTMLNVVLTLGPESFDPADLAKAMHNVHARAARPAMARPTAFALVAAYLFAWFLIAGTGMLVYANIEKHRDARNALLDSFKAVFVAEPNDRTRAAKECVANWKNAPPAVRREAGRMIDAWLDAPPEKPDPIREFANALKREAPPNE